MKGTDYDRYEIFEAAIERINAFTASNFSDYSDEELSKLFRDWSWLKRPGTDQERAQAYLEDAVNSDAVSLGEIVELFIKAWELKRGKVDYYHEISDSQIALLKHLVANLDIQELWYIMEDLFDLITDKISQSKPCDNHIP